MEIPTSEWTRFLDTFTQQHRGAHARLQVLGGEVGRQVETEDRPFDGISVDGKKGESTVWITFGSTPSNHFTHGIPNAKAIYAESAQSATAVEIEGADGSKTLLELSRVADYELPSAR